MLIKTYKNCKNKFQPSTHTDIQRRYGLASICDQNCDIQSMNTQTDRHIKRIERGIGLKVEKTA